MLGKKLFLGRIGHPYHNVTKSTDCMSSLMTRLTPYYFDKSIGYRDGFPNPISSQFLGIYKNLDGVIIWQVHPWIMMQDLDSYSKPIVAFPMYDNDRSLRAADYSKKVKYISFSKNLHDKITEFGCQSSYFQYFPGLSLIRHDNKLRSFDKAFFWYRGDVRISAVCKFCRDLGVKSLTIMFHPDPHHLPIGLESKESVYNWSGGLDVKFIDWLPSRSDLFPVLLNHDFYFAPRHYEGIGMSFLEAMAIGLIVVAPNLPTHNEYIVHGYNGLLHDNESILPINSTIDFRSMLTCVHEYMEHGRNSWVSVRDNELFSEVNQIFREGVKF